MLSKRGQIIFGSFHTNKIKYFKKIGVVLLDLLPNISKKLLYICGITTDSKGNDNNVNNIYKKIVNL
jgi:hypothetical protein